MIAFINKYKISMTCLVISFALLFVSIIYVKKNKCVETPCINDSFSSKEEIAETETKNEFFLEVKGAVKKPGVYKVNEGSIISDVITLSGGFKTNAYTSNINLSKKVKEEMVIYVFTKTEYKNLNKKEEVTSIEKECVTSTPVIDNCTSNGVSVITTGDTDTQFSEEVDSTSTGKLVNINTSSITELTTLTGIGEAKAKSIISYRETNGNFKTIEEIKNVSGIGDAAYEKIKDFITV